MNQFELGPAAVARIAARPVSVLSELSEPEIVDGARGVTVGSLTRQRFEALYQRAVEAGRERLWLRTAGDPHFMVRLAFTNPSLAERVLSTPLTTRTAKSRRQLGTTLYRYLARAAGRCEPLGMWAGVCLARWGRKSHILPSSPRLRIEPDLRPLYDLIRLLAQRPAYRSGPWQLNASLQREQDGSWTFWAPHGVKSMRHCLAPGATADALVERLMHRTPSRTKDLTGEIHSICKSRESAGATVEACINAGLLIGGMQPPWKFETGWQAMEAIEQDLLAADVAPWHQARRELQSICHSLEDAGDSLCVKEVLDAMAEARTAIRSLTLAFAIPSPELPDAVLCCDWKFPLEIQLGDDLRSRIEGSLSEYLRFQASYGFGSAIRRALLERYLPSGTNACNLGPSSVPGMVSGIPAPTWEAFGQAIGAGEDFGSCVQRWREILARGRDPIVPELPKEGFLSPPFGWLRVGLTAPPDQPSQIIIYGIFDDLWGPYARHAPFWKEDLEADPLGSWIRRRVAEITDSSGVELAELVAPCEQNPNALARPSLGIPAVSPWTHTPGALELTGAQIELRPGCNTPLLIVAGAAKPIAVLNAASAYVQNDPVVQLLLTTSFGATPGAILHAAAMVFADELDAQCPTPEVILPCGALARTRRTVLGEARVQQWLATNPAERFVHWCQLARAAHWPQFLLARRADGMTLPIHRDSPIAVAALLEGAKPSAIIVESWPTAAWIDDSDGRIVAELAIPFLRREHIWSHPSQKSAEVR